MNAPFTPEEIAAEGIKPSEYEEIVQRLGRHPNRAELGMFGVMWSEHCCYKKFSSSTEKLSHGRRSHFSGARRKRWSGGLR
ncbi:Phosphoribosylformylglycinamidine synthase, synthetase subunit [Crocosphaera watsonii WH 0003]|uniref:Phosphoribosylformylglycinamidine synthase, synthetase subunit n=1 Tax=Crocosphaera watsonii WH 0003 TaxID=423471 RepID=G5JE35_CROWT|nr:Phosphoribosylformylglycinamidine synthase, synthetase subunit [Crocosphaera watsonii WH 0003]EHJ13468.1 Phosphoribosylformylglycinamidine synthase, synthetase subunit [Crocosphaera watsonii WH 0003]